ncbi:MAG: tRNA (adenosine(37)-N6)-threonylcarbamoyltransferase complex ATPase subunit type 1 TsaE [Flavobacteriaceae bacterium]|nr:tRNA (adenosine(37)-N6)-threonylcarbamoyltransferase complex ATPase subunit type 1 TsaE [Flavobacteriaceae bacterium]
MIITYTLNDLSVVAKKIIQQAKSKILLFNGEMGSGKTTLIKEIIKQFGVNDNISSPTFSLVNEYLSKQNELIYHFDFYRIEDQEEALAIGIEDYFNKNAWCFIEWPKNAKNLLPLDAIEINILIIDDGIRKLEVR